MTKQGAPITITREVQETLEEGARAARKRGKETCFLLFGCDGVIVRADRVGEPVEHAAMTRPDFTASDELLQQRRHEGLTHNGQAHVHLGYGPASNGDWRTLHTEVDNDNAGYICVVANITGHDAVTLTGHTVDAKHNEYEHAIEIIEPRTEYEPVIPAARRDMSYLQIGIGSGGSEVAEQSAYWGVKKVAYLDHQKLETRNARRHHATRREAKNHIKKTTWARRHVTARTTSEVVTYDHEISPQHRDWLRETLGEYDLIAECSGHPIVRQIVSEECRSLGKPLVMAGVFERAKGGYVFVQHAQPDAACNQCLFKLTRHSRSDDHETIEHLTRDYGFTPEQLERQLGLFTDVSLTAILQAKVLLDLIRGVTHTENLYLIDNQALTLRKAFVKQSATCTNCHPELERSIA
jgi:molybdopterin/thiamine biosynthesis adenylyltransferase